MVAVIDPPQQTYFMHRYLPGILIVQIVTLAIFWVSVDASLYGSPRTLLLQAGVPALLISLVTALWFASIARADAERMTAKLRVNHARDREKLQVNAERTKAKLRQQAHKEIRKQERRVGRRANVKVGLAFTAATLAGVLMLLTEMLTLGLMTITTAGGAMGGYLLRWRQARSEVVKQVSVAAGGEPMPRIPSTLTTPVEVSAEKAAGALPVLERE